MKKAPYVVTCSLLVSLFCFILVMLAGCRIAAPPPAFPPPGTTLNGISMVDARNKTVILQHPPQRIVSLTPSNTEVLFAIGVGSRVVAGTTSDMYPVEATKIPHIDIMQANDLEKIESYKPDLVIGILHLNQKPLDALNSVNIPTLALYPRTVDETYSSIRLLGRATGAEAKAELVVKEMMSRIDAVRQKTAQAKNRPRVLIIHSANPIYTSPPDSFIHDLIQAAGGEDVIQNALPGDVLSPERGVELAPDVIICGASSRSQIKQIPGWNIIPAVRNDRFFTPSNSAILVQPIPRLAQGVEELARFLHPELFPAIKSVAQRAGAKSSP